MKKIVEKLKVLPITLMGILCSSKVLAAVDPSNYKGSDTYDVGSITNIGNQIITIVSTVGSIASVIVLVILGLKYMMGSAEEKAEYKKTLLPYAIGAALVFAASTIAGVIFNFTTGLGTTK